MGDMGLEMCYIPCFFGFSKWAHEGGLDSPKNGGHTGMPLGGANVCASGRCSGNLHNKSSLRWPIQEFSNDKLPERHRADDSTFFIEE